MTARVDLERETRRYYPGEVVTGAVDWSVGSPPLTMAVRLRWRTEGMSWPADTRVLGEERFDDPQAVGRSDFRFTLPIMPYSYAGKVLSIVWRVELVLRSRRFGGEKVEAFRAITMSPTGDAIDPNLP